MLYKKFKDRNLSQLGMGNMRLPVLPDGSIDFPEAQKIIDYVYDHGVNYYDTAYVYHQGNSEGFLGEALKCRPRDSYCLATKFPGFLVQPGTTPRQIFEEQLRRCRVDYFDFYLLHNVNEKSIQTYLDPAFGILEYFEEERRRGRIRNFGFSSHGKPEMLERFCGAAEWDFAQIQLNYLDWELQNAKTQYEILTARKLPVIVMEPLRGGRLADLSPELNNVLKASENERSIASWAFRWLLDLDNVQVILSGMSTMAQAVDNVDTFENEKPFTPEQRKLLSEVAAAFRRQSNVPCTACRYCCDGCPQKLDIPDLLNILNNHLVAPSVALQQRMARLAEGRRPADCIACGACVGSCPQSIDIPAELARLAAIMRACLK